VIDPTVQVHPTAVVEDGSTIGAGTRIWHFCHVRAGARIGRRCVLGQNVHVAAEVVLGDNVRVQNNVSIYSGAVVEDDVFLGPSCVLTNVAHPRAQVDRRGVFESIQLRRGCTVGANATLVAGVEIGRYALVAAGAVVVRSVPAYALVAGNPARQLGWVGRHGHRLRAGGDGTLQCPESGLRYREVEPGRLICLDLEDEAPLPPKLAVGRRPTSSFREPAAAPAAADPPQRAPIPLVDLRRHHAPLANELRAAVDRVLASGQFILGPETAALERECAAFLGVEHALAVSSGTDALLLALMALGLGPGDQVICPAFSFFATAGAVARIGARPVFVDVAQRCLGLDPEAVRRAITPRTKALLPVHLFGQCAAIGAIQQLAEDHGLIVIEDAAQAFGASYAGKPAGSFGAFGAFSFFPTKNLGGLGDGGLLITGDPALDRRARLLRGHGAADEYHHELIGGNFRMDALQAALLRVKLPHLPDYTELRRQHAERYSRLLIEAGVAAAGALGGCEPACGARAGAERPIWLPPPCRESHMYHQYVIRVRDRRRDALRQALARAGIATKVYYPVPLHLQPCFAHLGGRAGDCPTAERAAEEVLALPMFPELTDTEIERVVAEIAAFFAGGA
jgi:dTDP-4-amino-4,6-dideoxygalactose transaminase/acetyltransferase-like isoleucine patch superfamily enzyme